MYILHLYNRYRLQARVQEFVRGGGGQNLKAFFFFFFFCFSISRGGGGQAPGLYHKIH